MKSICGICGDECSGHVITKEARYFIGEKCICQFCFERLVASDYRTLDERAIEKIKIKEKK